MTGFFFGDLKFVKKIISIFYEKISQKKKLLIIPITSNIIIVIAYIFFSSLGPGPGRYLLPTGVGHRGPDPTKKLMPAYSFGKRLNSSKS